MSLSCGSITIGYRTPGLRELDAGGKMALAKELGLGVVEPQCAPHEINDLAVAEELGAAAREAGIAIPSVGCIMPLNREDEDLDERCDFAVQVSRALGCDYVFAVVMNPLDREERQDVTWQRVVRRCRQAVTRLGDAGVSLAIEPDHGAFVQNAERLEQLLDAVDDERLLVNLDLCNLYLGGTDPQRAIRMFAPRVRSGHIKDGFYHCGQHKECAIGAGELDWAALFACMRDVGLSCPMHIEHCQSAQSLRDSLAALMPAIESIGAATVA